MVSRFDPSAFVAAEEKQTLAGLASVFGWAASASKPAENSHSSASSKPGLATIAAIAGGLAENTPWAADLYRFTALPCPDHIPEDHWDELVNEAENVERKWGEKAYAFGWTALDLYGCPRQPLARHYGQSGLVHIIVTLLTPVRLVVLDQASATLQAFTGAPMRFRRQVRAGAVHLWEAYQTAGGP